MINFPETSADRIKNILIERYDIDKSCVSQINSVINRIFFKTEESVEDLVKEIKILPKGKELIKNITVDAIEDEYKDAIFRKYLSEALENIVSGSEIAARLKYTLYPEDVVLMANLHKEHKYRCKIDELFSHTGYKEEYTHLKERDYDELLNMPAYKTLTEKEMEERDEI